MARKPQNKRKSKARDLDTCTSKRCRKVDISPNPPQESHQAPLNQHLTDQTLVDQHLVYQDLVDFAKDGGPDLQDIVGYTDSAMSPTRRTTTGNTSRTKSISPGLYTKVLQKNGIYPESWGGLPTKPSNFDAISSMLQIDLEQTVDKTLYNTTNEILRQDPTEATMMAHLKTILEMRDLVGINSCDSTFNNLNSITKDTIPQAKPDWYDGASPSDLNELAMQELDPLINPSITSIRPIVPNFFVEVKSSLGQPAFCKLQAIHNGALGTRAMNSLQTFAGLNGFDVASVITVTLCAGHVEMFSCHSSKKGEKITYHTCFVDSWSLRNKFTFEAAVKALRNARIWCHERRQELITRANGRAIQLSEASTNEIAQMPTQPADAETEAVELSSQPRTSENEGRFEEVQPRRSPRLSKRQRR